MRGMENPIFNYKHMLIRGRVAIDFENHTCRLSDGRVHKLSQRIEQLLYILPLPEDEFITRERLAEKYNSLGDRSLGRKKSKPASGNDMSVLIHDARALLGKDIIETGAGSGKGSLGYRLAGLPKTKI